jgi:microcystin degradation protein MlrC
MRIAVAQISSESNHFVPTECDLEFFRNTGFLLEGVRLFELRGTGGEVAGMLSALDRDQEVTVAPLLAARANSGSPLSASCYSCLRSALLDGLEKAMPVDGVLLSHHGSMAAAGEFDPEGDIVFEVRRRVGADVPVIMTLDLHGNITRRMVESCTAILGYEQYPHRDTFHTGERAAELILRVCRSEVSPVMACAKLPMLLTAFHGTTDGDAPFGKLMRKAKELEFQPGVLSASMFFVGSYIDVPEMGSSALVVSDHDFELAAASARGLASEFWRTRNAFSVETVPVAEAVRRGMAIDGGPILLLDTADTTGGGAAGDGAGVIRGLLDAHIPNPCIAMVVDPQAALTCSETGVGAELDLHLGHRIDPKWGTPVCVRAKVLRVFEGRFRYTGGILAGTDATMWLSAVVQANHVSILIATYPTYDWADEQYRCAGLDPQKMKFVVVKNMMNFRSGYGDFAKAFYVLDIPGPTPSDMRLLPFRRVPLPIFPLDHFATDPEPAIFSNAKAAARTGL